jgi:hypothetical protein
MTNPKRPPLFNTIYKVGKGNVSLTVVVGEAQLGASLVRLGDKEIGNGDIEKLIVGKGDDLIGAKVSIKTVVADINDMTNRTSITLLLEGGPVPAKHTLAVEVDDNGDSAIYRSVVEFAK